MSTRTYERVCKTSLAVLATAAVLVLTLFIFAPNVVDYILGR